MVYIFSSGGTLIPVLHSTCRYRWPTHVPLCPRRRSSGGSGHGLARPCARAAGRNGGCSQTALVPRERRNRAARRGLLPQASLELGGQKREASEGHDLDRPQCTNTHTPAAAGYIHPQGEGNCQHPAAGESVAGKLVRMHEGQGSWARGGCCNQCSRARECTLETRTGVDTTGTLG